SAGPGSRSSVGLLSRGRGGGRSVPGGSGACGPTRVPLRRRASAGVSAGLFSLGWPLAEALDHASDALASQARLALGAARPSWSPRRRRRGERLGHQLGQPRGGYLLVARQRPLRLARDPQWPLVELPALGQPGRDRGRQPREALGRDRELGTGL